MSNQVGPMAWGSQGMVFLGEDLLHSRDYSENTSNVIDEEVERILREQEERAVKLLTENKDGLIAVATALLEKETVDGAEVLSLVNAARGVPGGDASADGSLAAASAATPDGSAVATPDGSAGQVSAAR